MRGSLDLEFKKLPVSRNIRVDLRMAKLASHSPPTPKSCDIAMLGVPCQAASNFPTKFACIWRVSLATCLNNSLLGIQGGEIIS